MFNESHKWLGYGFLFLVGISIIGLVGCVEKKSTSEIDQLPIELWPAEQIVETEELEVSR